jgi:hypothetical protein
MVGEGPQVSRAAFLAPPGDRLEGDVVRIESGGGAGRGLVVVAGAGGGADELRAGEGGPRRRRGEDQDPRGHDLGPTAADARRPGGMTAAATRPTASPATRWATHFG